MKDWKAIAKAAIPEVPAQEIESLLAPLAALEETFRPLVRDLTPDLEPATGLYVEREPK
jgi:hypothetical protein